MSRKALSILAIAVCVADVFADFEIVKDGIAKAAIVLDNSEPEGYRYAANELADFLGRMTKARITVQDKPVPGLNSIHIGTEYRADKDEELFIKVKSASEMEITGAGAIGTLYGVYDLLETFGCGFYTHDFDYVPVTNELKLAVGYEK